MEAKQEENKFGYISRWVIYDGVVQVADVHCTIPNVIDSIDSDDWLPDDEIEKYAHLLASADTLKRRAEAAEARAAELEIEAANLRKEVEQWRILVEQVETDRDEWKATAENQHEHLELARKDFMRRLRVVTRLWFGAQRERDAAESRAAQLEVAREDVTR